VWNSTAGQLSAGIVSTELPSMHGRPALLTSVRITTGRGVRLAVVIVAQWPGCTRGARHMVYDARTCWGACVRAISAVVKSVVTEVAGNSFVSRQEKGWNKGRTLRRS